MELSLAEPSRAPRSEGLSPLRAPAREVDRDVLFVALLVLALAALLEVTPARDGVTLLGWRLPEACGTKRFLDVGCPGCGLTRSFVLGVRADPEAFRLHPLGPALLLLVIAQVPYRGVRLLGARRLEREGLVDLTTAEAEVRPPRVWRALRWTILVTILATWVVRLLLGGAP